MPADWQATVSTARAKLQKPFLFSTPEVSQPLHDAPWHFCFMQSVADAINVTESFDSALQKKQCLLGEDGKEAGQDSEGA